MKKKRESGTMKKLIKKMAIAFFIGTLAFAVVPATVEAAGWKQNKNGYWWQENDYSYPKNQWKTIYGKQYHFNSSGYMDTGWKKLMENGTILAVKMMVQRKLTGRKCMVNITGLEMTVL